MGSLREFLAEQAERLKTEPSKAAARRDEWVAAVDRLNAQIREWIAQADPDHVLTIEERPVAIREERIGTYEVRGLTIALGLREVRVQPIARNVAGPLASSGAYHIKQAFGRVDLKNGLDKYLLYRTEAGPADRWVIVDEDGYRMEHFDRASFEVALQKLLD